MRVVFIRKEALYGLRKLGKGGSKRTIAGGQWVYEMLRSRGATIEMGTSEINHNIIAERILGLSRQ